MDLDNINWFPGHMAKAKRQIQENIKFVDAIAEIIDARVPISSRNLDILEIISNKPHLVVLNKSDIANIKCTSEWVRFYREKKINAIPMECNIGKRTDVFIKNIREVMQEKILQWNFKRMRGRTIKIMVIGIPNTGKSSLINKLSKKSRVKVENRPGVTRGSQWIAIDKNIELLDTPGILPPKIYNEIAQRNLAFIGAIKDDVLDIEKISLSLLNFLCENYPNMIKERYKIALNNSENISSYDIMEMIGKKRGFLELGGKVNFEKTAKMILSEFRLGKLGRITLEKVEN